MKNERKNLPRLFESVAGCFDEIHVTDTGSTDDSINWVRDEGAKVSGASVFLHGFHWINDFAAARNYAFSHHKTDYCLWMDLDDCLSDKEAFIQWRDNAMEFADCFLATYHYAFNAEKKPVISFMRERVFKSSLKPVWQFPLHEGIVVRPEWSKEYCVSWTINHMRDEEDIKQDRSRNITILEGLRDKEGLPTRLKFYYGKELYEMRKPFQAVKAFEDYLKCTDTDLHDKVLAYQYYAYSAYQCANQLKDEMKEEKNELIEKAIEMAQLGLRLDNSRAEFHISIGDAFLAKGDLVKAISSYGAAKYCINAKDMGSPFASAIFSFEECYGILPRIQIAKCYFHIGKLDDAQREIEDGLKVFPTNKELLDLSAEIVRVKGLINLDNGQAEVDEIVFTTPPATAYPFDEEIYKTKGLGGSETALVQVASWLKKLTGKTVKVFNMREEKLVGSSGVEWLPNKVVNEYFSKNKPKLHIMWRHNIKMTNAKSYLWCHDLVTPTVESVQNFEKIMCLSQFHKDYVMGKQGVKADKIMLTRNGLDPEKFNFTRKPKDHNKIVFMSSPDRGLDRAMFVCDELIKEFPEIKLHVYYGLENLYKYGLKDMAEMLKKMMDDRPYVVYHGFTEQSKMYHEVSDAVMWCHPANFIETFCITALEMLALGVFPVTRRLGALKNTLADAESKGQAIMLDHCASTLPEIKEYVDKLKDVILNKKWECVSLDVNTVSWQGVAEQWIKEFNL